ncbi:peroxiredoxin-5, mitochondrial-like protein, partial [Ramicandelaber brevisporus]
GVDEVVCVTVNDAFVSQAFAEKVNAGDKVRVLADPRAEFVKALGLSFDATAVLGNVRSQRFALVVENGIVKQVFPEPDKTGLSVSSAESVLAKL